MVLGIGTAVSMMGVVGARSTAAIATKSTARSGGKWGKRGLLFGVPFAAGIGGTDPLDHAISTFEEDVMGDPGFSERILGRQMSPAGIMGVPGVSRSYLNTTALGNASAYSSARSNSSMPPPPGSMVFGMFNSRMS